MLNFTTSFRYIIRNASQEAAPPRLMAVDKVSGPVNRLITGRFVFTGATATSLPWCTGRFLDSEPGRPTRTASQCHPFLAEAKQRTRIPSERKGDPGDDFARIAAGRASTRFQERSPSESRGSI